MLKAITSMNKFYLEGDQSKPTVLLDPYEKCLRIEGRSILDNAAHFYQPVIDWMTEYVKNPFEETILEVRLEYINTSSSKCLVDIFHLLEEILETENTVQVDWIYNENDDDLEEAGKDFESVVGVPFFFKPHNDNGEPV